MDLPRGIHLSLLHKPAIQHCDVEQSPQRHVRVEAALVLIQVQVMIDQERNVILHVEVDHILKRRDLQRRRIGILLRFFLFSAI